MAKAQKVRGLHAPCPACGTVVVINAETGEIEGLAREMDPNPAPVPEPKNPPASGQGGQENPPPAEPESFLSDW